MIRRWLVLAMAGLMSCTPSVEQVDIYSVLYDTTDPLLVTPKADALWQFVDGDATNVHLHIRYAILSDVDMNEVQHLERPAQQSGLFANAVQEKKRMAQFKNEFSNVFLQTDSVGKSHSAIFKPILAELDYLASYPKANRRHLVVYSDLIENSDWLNYYNGTDLWQLRHDTEAIVKRYLDQVPKDADYSGTHLHIVFQPANFEDNKRFKQLQAVYTQVFSELGVVIHFSANLTNANKDL